MKNSSDAAWRTAVVQTAKAHTHIFSTAAKQAQHTSESTLGSARQGRGQNGHRPAQASRCCMVIDSTNTLSFTCYHKLTTCPPPRHTHTSSAAACEPVTCVAAPQPCKAILVAVDAGGLIYQMSARQVRAIAAAPARPEGPSPALWMVAAEN